MIVWSIAPYSTQPLVNLRPTMPPSQCRLKISSFSIFTVRGVQRACVRLGPAVGQFVIYLLLVGRQLRDVGDKGLCSDHVSNLLHREEGREAGVLLQQPPGYGDEDEVGGGKGDVDENRDQ